MLGCKDVTLFCVSTILFDGTAAQARSPFVVLSGEGCTTSVCFLRDWRLTGPDFRPAGVPAVLCVCFWLRGRWLAGPDYAVDSTSVLGPVSQIWLRSWRMSVLSHDPFHWFFRITCFREGLKQLVDRCPRVRRSVLPKTHVRATQARFFFFQFLTRTRKLGWPGWYFCTTSLSFLDAVVCIYKTNPAFEQIRLTVVAIYWRN